MNFNMFYLTIRLCIWVLLGIGLYGALTVSYATITQVTPCPAIAGIRACYVVLAGYLAMCFAVLSLQVFKPPSYVLTIFMIGWVPVFLLAASGSSLEWFKGNICPATDSGLPLCYVSLALAIVIMALFFLIRKSLKKPDLKSS